MSRVLVADDEPAVLEVLTEVVEDLGHEVVRAHDGREALNLAREQNPALVVTDHMMPRLNGVELCRALKGDETLRQVPVIILSAALPPEASEANAYLAKPFELDEFEALVQRTLDGSTLPEPIPSRRDGRAVLPEPPQALINWVAHEMKTPLAAAKTNLQLLARKLAANGKAPDPQHFRSVVRQLESLEAIVDSLVDAARLSEGRLTLKREAADLVPPVTRAVEGQRALHPEHRFELQVPEGPVQVAHDPARLDQILESVLSNAVRLGAPSLEVRVEVIRREEGAEIRVQDFGPGITAEAREALFRRPDSSGWDGHDARGLGLYVASELAKLHGGKLEIRSEEGKGSTFVLTLPAAA